MDDDLERRRGFAAAMLFKQAGEAINAPILSGRLVGSSSGWLLLEVPNSLVRGVFDALDAPGAELPTKSTGALNAHVSVMRPEELKTVGGIEKITERGLRFKYQLGPLQEVAPAGWKGISKCWFIKIKSPELEKLRKSYGLSAKPNNDKYDFHATVAVRKKGVLQANEIRKVAGATHDFSQLPREDQNHGIQFLAGDDRAMREPGAQAVRGLRGARNYGLSKMAREFPSLFGGHGRQAEQDAFDRAAGERNWLHARELLLGDAAAASKEQEKQSCDHSVRQDPDACRVVRADGNQPRNNSHQDRSRLPEPGDCAVAACRDAAEKHAMAGAQRSQTVDHAVGRRTPDKPGGDPIPPTAGQSGGSYTDYVRGETQASASPVIRKLLAAKAESDRKNYAAKHALLRQALAADPAHFEVDSQESKYPGLTHTPTGFQTHAPRALVNYLQQLSATAP